MNCTVKSRSRKRLHLELSPALSQIGVLSRTLYYKTHLCKIALLTAHSRRTQVPGVILSWIKYPLIRYFQPLPEITIYHGYTDAPSSGAT